MIRLLWSLLLITFFFACKGDKHASANTQKRPVLKIWGAGRPDLKYMHAANIVGREYGLSYETVGRCTESKAFRDSLDEHNRRVYAQVNQEFGAGWQKEFAAKADSMEFLVSQAESFVQLETDFNQRAKEWERDKIILGLWTEPTEKRDVFAVEAYAVTLLPGAKRNVYYNWLVDLSNRKIIKSASCARR